jgi:hypothetical protein
MQVDYATGIPYIGAPFDEVAKTTSYTLVGADAGKRFTNQGATGTVTFTLPAIGKNMVFEFYVMADYSLTVTSAEGGNIIANNTVAANSLSFGTGGDKLGGCIRLESSGDGTKWLTKKFCANAMTIST